MTDVKKHYPKNPLRGALNAPGAVNAIQALREAAKNMDQIAEYSMSAVDRKIGELETLVAACGDPPSNEERETIYRLANEIFTEAGAFGYDACSQAAHSLCDLTALAGGRVEPIAIHIAALRGLRRDGASKMSAAIIAGLRKLSGGRS